MGPSFDLRGSDLPPVPAQGGRRDPEASFAAAVSLKIEDGNLLAAIRIVGSDDQFAPFSLENATKLREKHPAGNGAGCPLPPHPVVDPL